MRLPAREFDLVPAHALHSSDNANCLLIRFEDRSLLDMKFEHGAELNRAWSYLASVADTLNGLSECHALAIDPAVGVFSGKDARMNAGAKHRRRKTRSFLIGPVDEQQRRIGFVAEIVKRAHNFQTAEHAEDPIELATRGLRIQMTAKSYGRDIASLTRPDSKHVADLIDQDGAAECLALAAEPVPHPAIMIGQRKTADAALFRATDPRCLQKAVPEALRVYGKILHRVISASRSGEQERPGSDARAMKGGVSALRPLEQRSLSRGAALRQTAGMVDEE